MTLDGYVAEVVARKIAEKREKGTYPYCCTLSEIMDELREDVTGCMRSLHGDRYRASININKVPMLIETDNDNDDT